MGVLSALLLAGCENTVHGFGKDMENAGEKIQQSGHESSDSQVH
jgi:predicted small secreted protein